MEAIFVYLTPQKGEAGLGHCANLLKKMFINMHFAVVRALV